MLDVYSFNQVIGSYGSLLLLSFEIENHLHIGRQVKEQTAKYKIWFNRNFNMLSKIYIVFMKVKIISQTITSWAVTVSILMSDIDL